ncbi:MAG: hypothetical protein SVX43_23410 [Cyanobacteriota bacterium]|nr:hypothetical protein [Cyanobacteriota bacterium]
MSRFCKAARSLRLRTLVLTSSCAIGVVFGNARAIEITRSPFFLAQGLPARIPVPSQKLHVGLSSNPDLCDTQQARGWFYWYVDGFGQCYIVLASSQEQAAREAAALIRDSFHVIVSGYGFRDDAGFPL